MLSLCTTQTTVSGLSCDHAILCLSITFVLTLQSYIHEQAKTWMSRLSNKTLFCTCLKPLWQWVRKGNQRVRFMFLKNLEEPEDLHDLTSEEDEEDEEPLNTTELLREMAFEVVNALVLYSSLQVPMTTGSTLTGKRQVGRRRSLRRYPLRGSR